MKRCLTLPTVVIVTLASALLGLTAWACGAPQVPPGPEPEYQRPTVAPWEAGVPVDPLSAIEDDGEWVDDAPPRDEAPGTASEEPPDSGPVEPVPSQDAEDAGAPPAGVPEPPP